MKGGQRQAMNMRSRATNSIYRIGGLMGEHCVDRIEQTLSHLDGVSHVNVDQANKQVAVEYDLQQVTSDHIEETLQTLGYSIRGS